MPSWALPAIGLSVVALSLTGERLWPAVRGARGEWVANGVAMALGLLCRIGVLPLLATSETALFNALGSGVFDLAALPFPLGAALYLVAMDLGEYLFHRAQHAWPWMWAMHSLHHSDRAMNFSTSQRHFWLEPGLKAVSIWLAVSLLFRANGPILAVYAVASLYHIAIHGNLRLNLGRFSWLINAPQYHRLHHSRDPAHHNANFAALLPIFDVLSGAYRRPKAREFPDTGLDEALDSPFELLVWPVRRWLAPLRDFRRARPG